VVEITGPETKIDSFIQLMRRFGVKEIARSGRVALSRGSTVIKFSENGREPD
jgi:acetolactate synthase-1/3 small subunit